MIVKQYSDARATALALINEVLAPRLAQGLCHLAVSGGSTPKLLFELMAASPSREQINWDNLRLYWVDERCVPPSDAQSNYGMTARALDLDDLPLASQHIYRIEGEREPEEEARRYTALVCQHLPHSPEGLPQFDLVLLGIGDDGHTSSIFPHQMELLEEAEPYVVAQSPLGQQRICLTGQTILAAKTLVFHAVGASKGEILRQIKAHAPQAKTYPANYIAEHRSDLMLYTDQDLG